MYTLCSSKNPTGSGFVGAFVKSALIAPVALPLLAAVVFGALAYAWAGIPFMDFVLAYLRECPEAMSNLVPVLWTGSFFLASLTSSAHCLRPRVSIPTLLVSGLIARLGRVFALCVPTNRARRGSSGGLTGDVHRPLAFRRIPTKTPSDLAGSTPRLE